MEPRLESRYDEMLAAYLAAGFDTRQVSNTYNVAANALEQLMTLAILCVGALLVMRNDGFTIGMLVAFQMFASRMSQPMLRLAGLWQEFQQALDRREAPRRHHERARRAATRLVPSRAPEGRAEIQIADLAFRYSPEHPYLYRNLSLALKPGKLTVLTGPSGSRQEHARQAAARLLPARGRPHRHRRPRHPRTSRPTSCASTSASCRRRRCSSPARSTRTCSPRTRTRRSTTW